MKTRKTIQPVELDGDEIGLQRSKQLRELYESLALGDCNQQTKMPCALLSPEDLTDTEWYYLVCMSFTFNLGRGLPGKAFAEKQYTWLNNATLADPIVFPRSLLAKSAGIQTIVCIPVTGGVLELGTTEQVINDPALVMRITSLFLEIPHPACTEQSKSNPMMAEDADNSTVIEKQNSVIDCQTLSESDGPINAPLTRSLSVHMEFPGDSSNECCPAQQLGGLCRIDGLDSKPRTQEQQQQLMDDDFSNFLHGSFSSNEDVSMSFLHTGRTRNTKDSHYTNTITVILQNSKCRQQNLCSLKASHNSSFISWRRGLGTPKPFTGMHQMLLKEIIVRGAWLHRGCQTKQHREEMGLQEKVSHPGESGASHMLSERRRREKLNEKFLTLRSLVPSVNKMDKVSVIGGTISYLKELKRRVQQLETCRESIQLNTDAAEMTSDNHCSREMMKSKSKSLANKRKACEIDAEHHWVLSCGGSIAINATMRGTEVLVEKHCPWRERLLLQIVESMSELHLDPLVVQSSTTDGILALTIKSKFRSSIGVSLGMIKESLERVIVRFL